MTKTRYSKSTQRTQALGNDYFSDLSGMNRKARKIAKKRAKLAYIELGSTQGLTLAKNSRLDNRHFKVCQLSSLDYTPVYKSIGNGTEYEFSERYKKERHFLDKMSSKRSKN